MDDDFSLMILECVTHETLKIGVKSTAPNEIQPLPRAGQPKSRLQEPVVLSLNDS